MLEEVVCMGMERVEEKRRASGFRLMERDVEILGFLLDQKFASLEQVYFKFFDVRKSVKEALPKGLHVARQRLQILRKAGLIFTEKVYTESKSLYLLSAQGFELFQNRKPHDAFKPPMKRVDFRTYGHDTKVNDCRVALEKTGRVNAWLPDRRLKSEGFSSQYSFSELPRGIVPDGVFVSSKGERIAFELETSPRKKSRYESKKWDFLKVMRGENPLIHRVFWIGATDRIERDLREVVGGVDSFYVESYGHFLSKLWPNGQPEKV